MNMRVSGTSPSVGASKIDSKVQSKVNDALSKKLSAYGGGAAGGLDGQSISDTVNALLQARLYAMILKESEGIDGSDSHGGKKASDGDNDDYTWKVKEKGSGDSDSSGKPKLKEVSAKDGDTLYALAKRTLKLEKDDKNLSDDEKKKIEQFMTKVAEYNGLSAGKDQKLGDVKLTKDHKYQLYPPKAGSGNVDREATGSDGKKVQTKISGNNFTRDVASSDGKHLFEETMDFAAGTGTYTSFDKNGVSTKVPTVATKMSNGGYENKYTNSEGNRVFRQFDKNGNLVRILTTKKNSQGQNALFDVLKGKFVSETPSLSKGTGVDTATPGDWNTSWH